MDQAASDYRQAMRRLASTVCLVTAGDCGMAATAVMSLAADPPTLAVAVNRSTNLYRALLQHERFCVNLLASGHADLVAPFGGAVPAAERFEHGAWLHSEVDPPILADAQASLICQTIDHNTVFTHELFIGRVERTVIRPDVDPLIWLDGGPRLCTAITERLSAPRAPQR